MDTETKPGGDPLNVPQFKAEEPVEPPPTQCTICQQPFVHSFYEMNGIRICESCMGATERKLKKGSGFVRFLKASFLGVLAASLGAAIYGGIVWFTEKEYAIIAIAVGLLVGGAVRLGSERRGGKGYQFLAVLLTYMSICGGYVPLIVREFANSEEFQEAWDEGVAESEMEIAEAEAGSGDPSNPAISADDQGTTYSVELPPEVDIVLEDDDGGTQSVKSMLAGLESEGGDEAVSAGIVVIGLVVIAVAVMGLAMVAPFAAGFSNIIGLVIIFIGLMSAWNLNKAAPIEFTGPHPFSPPPPSLPPSLG